MAQLECYGSPAIQDESEIRRRSKLGPDSRCAEGRSSIRGSNRSGIERPARRLIGYLTAGGPHQATAPKLPRPLIDPARLGPKHRLDQQVRTKFSLQLPNLGETCQAHRLRKDSEVRAGLRTHLPPKKFPLQLSRKFLWQTVQLRCVHSRECSTIDQTKPAADRRCRDILKSDQCIVERKFTQPARRPAAR
jgi:hypothetical protein